MFDIMNLRVTFCLLNSVNLKMLPTRFWFHLLFLLFCKYAVAGLTLVACIFSISQV